VRFLGIISGGGVVAALGFIGSGQSLGPRPTAAILCLVAFASGVVCFPILTFIAGAVLGAVAVWPAGG